MKNVFFWQIQRSHLIASVCLRLFALTPREWSQTAINLSSKCADRVLYLSRGPTQSDVGFGGSAFIIYSRHMISSSSKGSTEGVASPVGNV